MKLRTKMRQIIRIAFLLCIIRVGVDAQKTTTVLVEPERFDQWEDILPNDENRHLDRIAAKAKEWPLSIIYLVVHAGQTACVGEARARGIRAKNYLVHRRVSAKRIVFIDAGWRKEVSVQVWIWPPELGRPEVESDLDLRRSEVTLERNCKIKHRRE